jgi:hypothetical protein
MNLSKMQLIHIIGFLHMNSNSRAINLILFCNDFIIGYILNVS